MERKLGEALQKALDDTFNALCDSFNTPAVMAIISELISTYNSAERVSVGSETTRKIAQWVTSIENMFGLNGDASPDDTKIGWTGIDVPEDAKLYLFSLSRFRDDLRQKARAPVGLSTQTLREAKYASSEAPEAPEPSSNPYEGVLRKFRTEIFTLKDSPSLSKEVLEVCDRVRDHDLWDLGIYLEDRDGSQPALVRPVSKTLRHARAEREARDHLKERAKLDKKKEAAARADKGRLSPLDMFRTSDEFREWDADGLPVRDKDGLELTKSRANKLRKEWKRQKKLHEAWVEANEEGPKGPAPKGE